MTAGKEHASEARRRAGGGAGAGGRPGQDWIPVPDHDAPGQPASSASGQAGTPVAPSRDRLRNDLLSAPEGRVAEDALVVRPSLRAAVERFLTVFSTLFAIAATFAIGAAVQAASGGRADVDPSPWPALGGLALANVVLSVFVPALVSLGPAVQIAFTRYVFDAEGIRERVQLLSRTERRVGWEKVTALHHRRTLLDRVLGIERLDVVAYGERGTTLRLVGLRQGAHLRGLVARQMRREATLGHLTSND